MALCDWQLQSKVDPEEHESWGGMSVGVGVGSVPVV